MLQGGLQWLAEWVAGELSWQYCQPSAGSMECCPGAGAWGVMGLGQVCKSTELGGRVLLLPGLGAPKTGGK